MKKNLKYLAIVCLVLSCTKPESGDKKDVIKIDDGTTIYGKVTCDGKVPMGFTVVSDGVTCVKTDADGVYQIVSSKKNGIVYICPPAYYTVDRIGSQPQFYQLLGKDPDTAERHDFALISDPDQDNHTRFVFGDIHVYNDNSADFFSNLFVSKVNKMLFPGVYKIPVGLTLGDMSWDLHWYKSNYRNTKYIALANALNLPVFNTVGNHDHDMKFDGHWINSKQELEDTGEDWTVEIPYREKQGPTCYSWNIGKIHYISMDDVLTLDDGTGADDGRGCTLGFTEADLQWLREDLKFVNPAKPIVLSVHIPFSNIEGTKRASYEKLTRFAGLNSEHMLEPFKGYNLQLVLSAHIHNLYNNKVTIGDISFPEFNCGAVCGHFWSTSPKGLSICSDGVPCGFRIMEWSGEKLKSNIYQPLEKKGFYPFRSYDRNCIEITSEKSQSEAMASGFYTKDSDNYVYISVWDWKEGWSISVKENGKELNVENVGRIFDPLALLMRSNGMTAVSRAGFDMRRVKASSANSTLVITVKDEYGNSATETMTRPKEFSIATYKSEDYSK